MTFTIQTDPQNGLLRLEGTFTFEGHTVFRDATSVLLESKGHAVLVLDLSGVGYMDSSALGMLLLLREKAEVKDMRVILSRPSPTVMTILHMVQFGRLFEIRED